MAATSAEEALEAVGLQRFTFSLVALRLPGISGVPEEGETLTGEPGRWSGTDPMAFKGQWRRCNAAGARKLPPRNVDSHGTAARQTPIRLPPPCERANAAAGRPVPNRTASSAEGRAAAGGPAVP